MNRYFVSFFIFMLQYSYAVGVSAGTEIKQRAYLNYTIDENITLKVTSNELIDLVDHKLDMKIVCEENDVVMVGAGTKRAMRFYLQNDGNGEDTYLFTPIKGESSGFEVENPRIYVDDGDGVFSIANDKPISELTVPADGNASLYFVSDIPLDAQGESSNGILSSSKKQEGLLYGESRKLDTYYVVMATEENANVDYCSYKVPTIALELEKKATLSSEKLFRGTTIHYEIILKVKGAGVANGIYIEDKFPEGTRYVENSLQLDGKSVDGVYDDGVSVAIEDIEVDQEKSEAEPYHQLSFDVKVI